MNESWEDDVEERLGSEGVEKDTCAMMEAEPGGEAMAGEAMVGSLPGTVPFGRF